MAKFNEYPVKATPEDNDTLMLYDAASKTNKLSPFSGIWNWMVNKLTNAVINNLQTSNKTVVGAINELNSKALKFAFAPNTASFYDSLPGMYFLVDSDYKNLSDKPNGFAGRAIWIYCTSNNSDERIGILACAGTGQLAIGYCYGGSKLVWKEISFKQP